MANLGVAILLQVLGWGITRLNTIVGEIIWGLLAIVGVYLIWRAYKQQKKQRASELHKGKDSGIKDIQEMQEVQIEVFETKCAYNGDIKCFLVVVVLRLKTRVVPRHLAWIRLVIAGKEFDPISSKPPLVDEIKHAQQKYELEYEVDTHTFLKGRYVDSNAKRSPPNCWGSILANVGGADWKSEEFEIV